MAGDTGLPDEAGGQIDKDWYAVTLERNHSYVFDASSTSITTGQVAIALYNSAGGKVLGIYGGGSNEFVEGANATFSYTTTSQVNATQIYYVAVSAGGPIPAFRTATGGYTVRATDSGAIAGDAIAQDTTTTATLAPARRPA